MYSICCQALAEGRLDERTSQVKWSSSDLSRAIVSHCLHLQGVFSFSWDELRLMHWSWICHCSIGDLGSVFGFVSGPLEKSWHLCLSFPTCKMGLKVLTHLCLRWDNGKCMRNEYLTTGGFIGQNYNCWSEHSSEKTMFITLQNPWTKTLSLVMFYWYRVVACLSRLAWSMMLKCLKNQELKW